MSEILDYFDNIDIDVAKRKYYNVNKVNAVLDDLRKLAEQLVDENERQRSELSQLTAELGQKKEDDEQARGLLSGLQNVYRETLTKAHDRADEIVRDAKAQSETLRQQTTQDLEQQRGLAAEQLRDCFRKLQDREEESIRLLNSHLERILSSIQEGKPAPAAAAGTSAFSSGTAPASDEASFFRKTASGHDDVPEEADLYQLRALELQIQRLSEEINALETGR